MTLQIAFLFGLLAVMVYLFLTEKLPVDLTAFLGLSVLIFTGYVTPAEAFQGFSSSAVITMLSVFIVGAALLETGVADSAGSRIHHLVGDSETRMIVVLMLVAGILSAFMNNIAATAVLMPAVASLAPRAGIPPSRLFMPLAFGAILGGTTTLVGTPPNILAAQVMVDQGMTPFELFDFTPVGLALLATGTLFMVTVGRRLLPATERGRSAAAGGGTDLAQIYQLQDRIFSLKLPARSALDGKTLAETRLGSTLGVKVVAIEREGRRIDPQGSTALRAGDVLIVEGEPDRVREFLRMEQLQVERLASPGIPSMPAGVEGLRLKVEGMPLAGQTLRELDLRNRYGVVVLGIRHRRQLYTDYLAEQTVRLDDELLVGGLHEDLERLAAVEGVQTIEIGPGAIAELAEQLWVIDVPEGSELEGRTIGQSRFSEVVGVTVAGIIRNGETRVALTPDEKIHAGDRLLVAADLSAIRALGGSDQIELGPAMGREALDTDETTMIEVAVAPRSAADGRTLQELDFGDRYGMVALALWRGGRPIHTDLARIPLRFGDALLLHGLRDKVQRLADDADFVVLSETAQAKRRTKKAPYALGALLLMVGLVVTGAQPINVASFTAASLAILFGALTMKEAYRVIEWRAIFLVAAVLPVGFAMERSGAAQFIGDSVASSAGALGAYGVLAALVVLASMLSQGLDGAPAVVLLAPVVFELASEMQISPYPLLMGASIAASAAFMTPFSHKANLLVMGAGGYRSSDYVRVGTPLTFAVLALIILLVPVFFPF